MKIKLFGIITAIITLLVCTACPPEPDPEHTHEYDATWTYDATQHWRECTAHDGAKTDEAAHTAGDWIIDTPATATTAGSRHKECTVCGYVTGTEVIPTTHTHTYATTWSKDATQHWHECSCGDKTDVADHDWEWKVTTPATPTADGLETETCKTCGATNGTRIIEQTEPTVKTFSDIALFETYKTTIQDNRTACGKQNLQQLSVVTMIQEEIVSAFNNAPEGFPGAAHIDKFRNVFGAATGSVTIFVENSIPAYTEIKYPDRYTMCFHIDYLQSKPADIQEKIRDAVFAMNDMPHQEYDPPNPATITQGTPNGLAFAGTVTIKTSDQYTAADWDAVVANVITAFNAAYEGASDTYDYDAVSNEGDGIKIVLDNNLSKDWEVKQTLPKSKNDYGPPFGVLYIKTSSILTITALSYESAMVAVGFNNPATSVTNATPAKDRVFLS